MNRSIRRRVGFAVALGSLLALGAAAAYRRAPRRFQTVHAGRLHRSAVLPSDQLRQVIRRYGIRTVVNLRSASENREDWHAQEAEACRAEGAVLCNIPLEPQMSPDERQLQAWLDLLHDPYAHPILVHCKHGVVRTNTMVAIHEMSCRERDPDEVLATLPWFGHELRPHLRAWLEDYPVGGCVVVMAPAVPMGSSGSGE